MPTKIEIPWDEVQSDAWWERAARGKLSPTETRIWQAYLAACPSCRREWETLTTVEHILQKTPPPTVSADFTQATLQRLQKTTTHTVLSRWIGITLLAVVLIVEIAWLGHAALSALHLLEILIAGKQVWWEALVLTWSNFLISWQILIPFALALALLASLWCIPNGLIMTAGVLFWTRHRVKRTMA